jgi:hypothetical protein
LKQQELVGKMVKCARKHKRMFCFDSEPHGWSVAMLDLDRDSFFSLKKKNVYGCCVCVCTRWQNKEKVLSLEKKKQYWSLCVFGEKSSFGAAELLLSV